MLCCNSHYSAESAVLLGQRSLRQWQVGRGGVFRYSVTPTVTLLLPLGKELSTVALESTVTPTREQDGVLELSTVALGV